jgi:RNA polymerase subunit RPABC4/transcription elongation factor Spt4
MEASMGRSAKTEEEEEERDVDAGKDSAVAEEVQIVSAPLESGVVLKSCKNCDSLVSEEGLLCSSCGEDRMRRAKSAPAIMTDGPRSTRTSERSKAGLLLLIYTALVWVFGGFKDVLVLTCFSVSLGVGMALFAYHCTVLALVFDVVFSPITGYFV